MTKEEELKKINIDLLKAKQGFIPQFGNMEDLKIIEVGNKMRTLRDKNKLKAEEEVEMKKHIIFLLKKRNEHIGKSKDDIEKI
jgi:hypothetical protein